MGLLDTIEGLATGQSAAPTDEDHIEDGLDGAADLLDDVGGMLDQFGLTKAAGALNGVNKCVAGAADIADQLLGNQTATLLPIPTYYVSLTGPDGGGSAKPWSDPGFLSSLTSMSSLEKMASNGLAMAAGTKAGQYLSDAEGAFLGSNTPKEEQDPRWWVHEFQCTEYLNDLFEMKLHLIRREGQDVNGPSAVQSMWDQAKGGNISAIGQMVSDITDPTKLADDLLAGTNPGEAFFDKGFPAGALDPDSYIGQLCSVHVSRKQDDGTIITDRWFTGVVTAMMDMGKSNLANTSNAGATDAIRHIRLTVRPSLWKLSLQTNCRIYENKNSIAIVKQILKEAGIYQLTGQWFTQPPSKVPIPLPIPIPISKSEEDWTPVREYCVQYNETDLDFVKRILAEDGISFFFDHQFYSERIVLLDNSKAGGNKCKTINGKPAQFVAADQSSTIASEAVWAYRTDMAIRPVRLTVRDFNLSLPDDRTEMTCGIPLTDQLQNFNATTDSGVGGFLGDVAEKVGGMVMGAAAKMLGQTGEDYGVTAEHYQYPARFTLARDFGNPQIVAYKRYDGANTAKYLNKSYRGHNDLVQAASNLMNVLAGGSLRVVLYVPTDADFDKTAVPDPKNPGQMLSQFTAADETRQRMTRQSSRGIKLILTSITHTGQTLSDADIDQIQEANTDKTAKDASGNSVWKDSGKSVDSFACPNYFNTFTAVVSETTPLKPPPIPAKPVIAGIQTATVLDEKFSINANGDADSPSACDEMGRVHVLFHWDRRHDTNGVLKTDASAMASTGAAPPGATSARAYLRVAQPLAGSGWGVHFTPRAGMEVAVGFLEGDPDRPVILGCLHNVRLDDTGSLATNTTANLPPFPPRGKEDDYTRSGIVTQSVGKYDAKYSLRNRLAFQDLAQSEIVEVWATRNFRTQVLGDYQVLVFEDLHNSVKGDQSVDILGNETRTLKGFWRQMVTGKDTVVIGTLQPSYNDPNNIMPIARNLNVTGNETFAVGPYDPKQAPVGLPGNDPSQQQPPAGQSGVAPAAGAPKTAESAPTADATNKWSSAAQGAKFNRTEFIGEWDIRLIKGNDGKTARPAEVNADDAYLAQIRGHRNITVEMSDKVVTENDRNVLVDGALKVTCGVLNMGAVPDAPDASAQGANKDGNGAATDPNANANAPADGAATGLHSVPNGLRLDAQTEFLAHANGPIHIHADLDDKTKGLEISGPKAVHFAAGAESGEHIALQLEEETQRIYLRGRTGGVCVQWGDKTKVLITPTGIILQTAKASIELTGDSSGFDLKMKGTMLQLDFSDDMFVEALEGKVDMGATTTVDPNSKTVDDSNNPKVLVDQNEDHTGAEEQWNEKHKASAAASNDPTQVDKDHDHYDPNGQTKQYKPPPDNTMPPATPAPGSPPPPGGPNPP